MSELPRDRGTGAGFQATSGNLGRAQGSVWAVEREGAPLGLRGEPWATDSAPRVSLATSRPLSTEQGLAEGVRSSGGFPRGSGELGL